MASLLSETRPGRVIQLIGAFVILIAIADYVEIINLLSIWVYPVVIAPFGFLRWVFDQRYDPGDAGSQTK